MPRKKRQTVNFPTEIPPSSAELDAAIDGVPTPQDSTPEVEQIKRDSKRKKELVTAVKEIPQIFTPEQVVWVFSAYCMALSFIYSVVLKSDYEKIHAELEIDEAMKAEMAKPLAKIASKYAPSEWAGMTDEIQLVAQIGIYTATSFGRAKLVAEKERERIVTEQRKNQTQRPHLTPQSVAESTVAHG